MTDSIAPSPVGAPALCRGAPRVVVAMSGGVDSSVAAGLLKRSGADVVGITLQLYDDGVARGRTGSCCAGQDIHDARRVADRLGIPHYVLDYERRFRDAVMRPFAESYLAGETPVPCVSCNSAIKFADLLAAARELGADQMVTGHYVERRLLASGPALYRAAEVERDQSYFLFATTRSQLAAVDFPLGALAKARVRELAVELGLPVAAKADSQDICFVPNGRYTDVIERLAPGAVEPGEVVDTAGRVLGRHKGVAHFTVGQRKGLGVASATPLYVVRLDAASRQVVVGPREALLRRSMMLRAFNWIGDGEPPVGDGDALVWARVRSTRPPQPARLRIGPEGSVSVSLEAGEFGIAPGQACVLYADGSDRARVLGGGFIARVLDVELDEGRPERYGENNGMASGGAPQM